MRGFPVSPRWVLAFFTRRIAHPVTWVAILLELRLRPSRLAVAHSQHPKVLRQGSGAILVVPVILRAAGRRRTRRREPHAQRRALPAPFDPADLAVVAPVGQRHVRGEGRAAAAVGLRAHVQRRWRARLRRRHNLGDDALGARHPRKRHLRLEVSSRRAFLRGRVPARRRAGLVFLGAHPAGLHDDGAFLAGGHPRTRAPRLPPPRSETATRTSTGYRLGHRETSPTIGNVPIKVRLRRRRRPEPSRAPRTPATCATAAARPPARAPRSTDA